MKVFGDRVLVKKIDPPKTTSSLIEVVQFHEEESQFAIVLGVGNGSLRPNGVRYPPEVEKGDTVVIKPYSGTPVKVTIKNKEIEAHMLQEEDVLAVITNV